MALIRRIAHCNGVISERGEDKGVRRDISKHRPTATADVRPREAQPVITRRLVLFAVLIQSAEREREREL